jgi:hypothetical protein
MSKHKPADAEPERGSTGVAGCTARCDAELRKCIEKSNDRHVCEPNHQVCVKECGGLGELKSYSGLGGGSCSERLQRITHRADKTTPRREAFLADEFPAAPWCGPTSSNPT